MTSLALQLGRRALRLRRQRRKSQAEIANLAGISVAFLSMIERGRRLPHLGTASKLAAALGVTLSQLFRFDARD